MMDERMKQIFDEAFGMKESRLKMYAACEAVLAASAQGEAQVTSALEDANATIARLSAPVSDEEWHYLRDMRVGFTREAASALIAARAQATAPQPKGAA